MIIRYFKAALAALNPDVTPRGFVFANPMSAAFDSAMRDVGEREVPMGSNSGPYVDALRAEVNLPRLAGGEWCAVFCSVHMQRVGVMLKSRGARKLVGKLTRKGRQINYSNLCSGMAGLSLHTRAGGAHVRMWQCVEEGGELVINCVGGNEKHQVRAGKFAAKAYCAMAREMSTL